MSTSDSSLKIAMVGREMVAERTMSFRFEKPAGWLYRAGQSLDMTLIDPPETDAEGNLRAFTISSAPREKVIQITTRLRDTAFKRVLQRASLGTEVKIEGPFGDLRLHHAARPAVLLAGGIGITPFRSILVEAIGGGSLPYRVILFHAEASRPRAVATSSHSGPRGHLSANGRTRGRPRGAGQVRGTGQGRRGQAGVVHCCRLDADKAAS